MATGTVYKNFKLTQFNGSAVDLDAGAIKFAIMTSSFSVNQTHQFWSDISANQVATATAYTGPITLSGVTVALDGNDVEFAHSDISVAQDAGGFTNGQGWVYFNDTGTPTTSRLILAGVEASVFGNTANSLTFDVDPATGVLKVV